MNDTAIDTYNIQPLVIKLEKVIKNGLNIILSDYNERYELLEKTHRQIMKLPSVLNELNRSYEDENENCNKTINSKIDLSNEDHCGTCGQYVMTKTLSYQQTNIPIDLIHYMEKK